MLWSGDPMKADWFDTPRVFTANQIDISHVANVGLEPYEMITFQTPGGRECDFTATPWGFYLGPSLNSRLKSQGFRTALVINEQNRVFVNAVEVDKIDEFKTYLKTNQNSRILCWLDEWLAEEPD